MAESRFRVFKTVVETGSITKAAKLHAYSQPGVSHLIDSLEEDFGIQLLNRTKKGTTLTPEGEIIYPYIAEMIRNMDMAVDVSKELRGLEGGRLNIGTFTSVALQWIPDLLNEYKGLYPNIEINLINGNYAELEENLKNCYLHCAFLTEPSHEKYHSTFICEDPMVAVLPSKHPLAGRKHLKAEELAKDEIIIPAEGDDYDLAEVFRRMGQTPNMHYKMNDDFAAVGMVRAMHGITFLPALLLENYDKDGIVTIPIEGIKRRICLVYANGKYVSPTLKAFEELVLEKYGK
jgi:DNA-binding transcriptional LysR family regulator